MPLAVFVTEAGLLDATERHLDRRHIVIVDPADSGLKTRRNTMSARQIAGEYAGSQPEARRIRPCDNLILVAESQHRHHRSKDFFANDGHIVRTLREYGRPYKIPAIERTVIDTLAAIAKPRTFSLPRGDEPKNALHVRLRYQSADLRLGRQRIADTQLPGTLDDHLDEPIINIVVNEDARAIRADLALRIEIAEQGSGYRLPQIGILKDNERRLAAQLHGCALERSRRGGKNLLSGPNRPGQ